MLKKLMLIALAVAASAQTISTPGCFLINPNRAPLRMCANFSVIVPAGGCTTFSNPCLLGNEWIANNLFGAEEFDIPNLPTAMYLHDEITGETRRRALCAYPGAVVPSTTETFIYGHFIGTTEDFANGRITFSTLTPIAASASASPARIRPGESSQLVLTPAGGVPPYSYSWTPTSGISTTNIPAPTASPAVDTVYTGTVIDRDGRTASATVAVAVQYEIQMSANPPQINPSDTSQLSASSIGGRPPYTYSWSPVETLSSSTIQSPVAAPLTTTTYTLVATDANGARLTGSVQVRVNLLILDLTASHPSIAAGQTTQLDVTAAGGDGSYTYLWWPAAGLSDAHVRNPVATPATSTDYQVVVSDGSGSSMSAPIHVTVVSTTTLGAAFSILRGAHDVAAQTVHWTFDASASSGSISSYTWHAARANGTTVLDTVTSGPVLSVDLPEDFLRGDITLTVGAPDGTTATVTQAFR